MLRLSLSLQGIRQNYSLKDDSQAGKKRMKLKKTQKRTKTRQNANSFCIISIRFGLWIRFEFELSERLLGVYSGGRGMAGQGIRRRAFLFGSILSVLLIWFIINFIVTRHLRAIILVVGFYGRYRRLCCCCCHYCYCL